MLLYMAKGSLQMWLLKDLEIGGLFWIIWVGLIQLQLSLQEGSLDHFRCLTLRNIREQVYVVLSTQCDLLKQQQEINIANK